MHRIAIAAAAVVFVATAPIGHAEILRSNVSISYRDNNHHWHDCMLLAGAKVDPFRQKATAFGWSAKVKYHSSGAPGECPNKVMWILEDQLQSTAK